MNMKCSSLFNGLLSYAKISPLIVLLLSGLAVAIDFEEYDDDVAALLREYQSHSDSKGSYNPSVLSFNETEEANTLVDFENGLVFLTAITPETLKQSIIDVLLTQIDPSVIDAKTAQDFENKSGGTRGICPATQSWVNHNSNCRHVTTIPQ